MVEVHLKYSIVKNGKTIKHIPSFKCCDTLPDFIDLVSSNDNSELVIKKCKKCEKNYKEETIWGKPSAGYPHIRTFLTD